MLLYLIIVFLWPIFACRLQKYAGKDFQQQTDPVQRRRHRMRVHGADQHVVRGAQLHGVCVFRTKAHDRRNRPEHDYYRYVHGKRPVNIISTHMSNVHRACRINNVLNDNFRFFFLFLVEQRIHNCRMMQGGE